MKKILIFTLILLLCLSMFISCGMLISSPLGGDESQMSGDPSSEGNQDPTGDDEGNGDNSVDNLTEESTEKDDEESRETAESSSEQVTEESVQKPDGTENSSEESSNDSTEDHEHSYGDWIVTRDPSCTVEGEKERRCSCGETRTKPIDALGHDMVHHVAKAPTCSDAGWDAYETCARCGYSTKAERYAPHSWKTEYTFDREYHWYECSICGAEDAKESHETDSNGCCLICNQIVNSTSGIVYELRENGAYAVVVDYTGTETSVTVSDVYEGAPVKVIGDNAFKDKSITKVIIPNSIETIGKHAFAGCSGLKSITVPDSVTSIGQHAFYNCSSLESMTLPFVGENKGNAKNAFLAYIFGADGYGGNSNRYVPQSLKKIVITESVSLEDGAFYACAGIETVELAGGVTSIGKYAFYSCTGIESIKLPDSVKSIGNFAFQYCTRLKNIDLGNGVTEIMGNAFDGCTAITDITIPESVETIGSGAFKNCTGIKDITIPDSVTTIVGGVFVGCTNLERISIPFIGEEKDGTGATHIGHLFGAGAYRGQNSYIPTSLKTVVITSAESIAENAFRDCNNFTRIFIPKSVTSIGDKAFSGCTGITNVYYGGTASEWDMISIGATNDKLKNATITYNCDPR
ncbi:MAG: leucine-rich repeat protein [Clostridia bacterium]|nr:leucine-rich repeat protein [Clostridia bacterium]